MDELLRQILLTILICLLAIIDISLTTKNKKKLEKVKPEKNPEDYEANQVVVWLWKKIGVDKTKIIYLILAPLFWATALILIFFFINSMIEICNGFIIGCYTIINYLHILNIVTLNKWEEEQKISQETNQTLELEVNQIGTVGL